MKREFEMTEADFERIMDAGKPVPYLIIGGHAPRSPQERANDAWAELGKRMGFDFMSVRPTGRGNRFFTADEVAAPSAPPCGCRVGECESKTGVQCRMATEIGTRAQ